MRALLCFAVFVGFARLLHAQAPEERPPQPTEFETQILAPTGGHLTKPKGWVYTENHEGPAYIWTISREDPARGPYTTGFRLQAFAKATEVTGKPAREFVLDFLAKRKAKAKSVYSVLPPKELGPFTRAGMDLEEGPFRMSYVLFWGTHSDTVVISVAATYKEFWDIYAPAFQKMGEFQLTGDTPPPPK